MGRAWLLAAVACACSSEIAQSDTDAARATDGSVSDARTFDAPVLDAPAIDGPPAPPHTTRMRISSRCTMPIWIAHSDNVGDPQNIELQTGEYHDYAIPDAGLASTRFWPKLGCDAGGHACKSGDTGDGGGRPCGATGCQPPVDSKFEATFAAIGGGESTFYNLSQVDGYSLPFAVVPSGAGAGSGSCVASSCAVSANACPGTEDMSGGGTYPQYASEDLRIRDDAGQVIACLAPCKKWNYSAPYGLGQPESQDPGLHLCCPTPPIGPTECSDAANPLSVVHTHYVQLLRSVCPSAYSYAYDDAQGTHVCPAAARFEVIFCP